MPKAKLAAQATLSASPLKYLPSDFDRPYLVSLNGFLTAIEAARVIEDPTIFCQMLATAFGKYEIKQLDLARQLEVENSTVGRWAKQESTPNLATRQIAKAYVVREVEKQISALSELLSAPASSQEPVTANENAVSEGS